MAVIGNFLRAFMIFFALLFIGTNVYAGRLYIKPDLERKRAERLLEEAETDFRSGKIHIGLSPDISVYEFQHAREKFKQVIEIVEKYGEGFYSPGDVEDFNDRMNECELWVRKAREAVTEDQTQTAGTVP